MNKRQAKRWAHDTAALVIEQYLEADEAFDDQIDQEKSEAALWELIHAHRRSCRWKP